MSPLSSGVAPFAVSLARRTLPVTLASAKTIEPGQELTIKLTTTPNRPRRLSLPLMRGILQVARYTTPNPLGEFFAKRSLEVETLQILNLILPEFSRLLNAAAPGGGDDEAIGGAPQPI